MNFLHHLLAGDWSEEHAVDDALLEQGLHYGRLWEVTIALNLEGLKRAYQGDFAGARERVERLGKLADQYQHALATSAGQFLTALLHLERRELREAIAALDYYADEHPEVAFRISALGHRAAAEWLRGDADGAEATLQRAERLVREAGRVLPYHLSDFLRSRYLLDVHRLETAGGDSPRSERSGCERRARRSRKAALASSARVAWRRPEVLRTAGTHAWLLGHHREARARWGESLDWARRLGMRPDQARTQVEMGRRVLSRAGESDTQLRREAIALLEAARRGFESLGLETELRELSELPRD
jgi:tetratricopeptide (TPR) repeat protein